MDTPTVRTCRAERALCGRACVSHCYFLTSYYVLSIFSRRPTLAPTVVESDGVDAYVAR